MCRLRPKRAVERADLIIVHHPIFAVIFFSVYLVGAVCCGVFALGPTLSAVPDKKIKLLAFIWAVIIFLGCVAQYYGLRFMDDRSPSVWRSVLPPGFFAVMFVSGLVRRALTKRAHAGNHPSR